MRVFKMKKSKISVALCTFNGEKYIKEQLESIIGQTKRPDEIIIVDDGSTDKTVEICNRILRQFLGEWTVYVNDVNLGYKRNFLKAMKKTSGDVVFLSDQDDVWLKGKIEIMMRQFEDDTVLLAFHDVVVTNERLVVIEESFWKTQGFFPNNIQNINDKLLQYDYIQGASCAIRRNLIEKITEIPVQSIHDEWLGMIAAAYNGIAIVPEKLSLYRQGEHNVIGVKNVRTFYTINKYISHISKACNDRYEYLKRRRKVLEKFIDGKYSDEGFCVSPRMAMEIYSQRIRNIQKKKLLSNYKVFCAYSHFFARPIREFLADVVCMMFIK